MIIKNIHIGDFGCLQNRDFALCDGLNLFEGNNETGKSTILSFIRFVLFGLPKRNAGETVSERERGLSWSSGIAEGYMDIESDGKIYRISRRGQLRGSSNRETYSENTVITDIDTGLEVFHGEVPGKIFLGITSEVFTSTSCVRQLDCTHVEGEDVKSSIENLLFSADESINVQKVQDKLDDLRRGLLYKNGRGGKLFELEVSKTTLKNQLDTARSNTAAIIEKEIALEKAKELSKKRQKEMEQFEAQLHIYDTCVTLGRFETLHETERKKESATDELNRLAVEKGFGGILPEREISTELEKANRRLQEADLARRKTQSDLAIAEQSPRGDLALASAQKDVEAAGGKQAVIRALTLLIKKRKTSVFFSILLVLLGIVTTALGVLCFLETPLPLPLSFLPYGQYIALGAGAAFLCISLVLAFVAKGKTKKIRSLQSSVHLEGKMAPISAVADYLDRCEKNFEESRRYDNNVTLAKESATQSTERYESASREALQLLTQLHRAPASAAFDSLSEALQNTAEESTLLCNQKETIKNRISICEEQIASYQNDLKNYNENTLRSIIGFQNASELLSQINIEKTRGLYNLVRSQKDASEQKKLTLEKELVALNALGENPARITAKLDAAASEYSTAKLRHDALVAASQILTEATDKLHQTVTPTLRLQAGEFMSRMTDGKYKQFGITNDMDIHIVTDSGTKNIDAYSKGTKDAAYISLRMALVDLICTDNPPPLCFDESFTQMDDARTAAMLKMLQAYCQNGNQCLVFTCHKREGDILAALGQFKKITLQ